MEFFVFTVLTLIGVWFLPSTRKRILERIAKEKVEHVLNRQRRRDLEKFTQDYYRPLAQGERAEQELEYALKRKLCKKQWYVFKNITLNHRDGTTQVDLIALSVFGVFVIEVKDFSGKIYTNDGKYWVQYLANQKYTFPNPHRQNFAHVEAVRNVVQGLVQPEHIHSMVAFLGKATFKSVPANTFTSINSVMKALQRHNQPVLELRQMIKAIGILEYQRKYDLPETHEQLVAYIKRKHPELKP